MTPVVVADRFAAQASPAVCFTRFKADERPA